MSKFELKLKAETLRRKGESIGDIAKILKISKSTSSLWCRSIFLSEAQASSLHQKMVKLSRVGRLKGAEMNRNKKLKIIENSKKWAIEIFNNFPDKVLLATGISLYWAEGSKSESTNRFVFVNSDPRMIVFMMKWLKTVMGIKEDYLMPRISINIIHKPRINKILKFWSDLLGLTIDSFGKPVFINISNKKKYSNYSSYYGIIRLSIKNGSDARHKMLSLIEILNKHMSG